MYVKKIHTVYTTLIQNEQFYSPKHQQTHTARATLLNLHICTYISTVRPVSIVFFLFIRTVRL